MMSTRGRVRLPGTLTDYLQYLERAFIVLPITGAIAEQSMLFGGYFPKDPTDRLVAATAVAHGLALVTKDEKIRNSGALPCIW